MSKTPRTDAAEIKMQCGFKEVPTGTVSADFARQLESENAGLREALADAMVYMDSKRPGRDQAYMKARALLAKEPK